MARRSLWVITAFAAAALLGAGLISQAESQTDPSLAKYIVGDEKSGYVFAESQTRAMQDDDFSNPGFLWVDRGKSLWTTADGTAGKSCATCHGADASSMKGVAATYPKYDATLGRVIDIEERINDERVRRMGATPYTWESDQMLSLTAFVALQSRGMPIRVATDGPAHEAWLAGKKYFETRRGQLDMSCEQCHGQNSGNHLRSDILSQGQTNDFPVYRLAWQGLGSVQRRFRECNQQVRAEPLPYGSPEYVALELYVASRGQGLPDEAPGVRK